MRDWQAWLFVMALLAPLVAFVVQLFGLDPLKRHPGLFATLTITLSLVLSLMGLGLFLRAEGRNAESPPREALVETDRGLPSELQWIGTFHWLTFSDGSSNSIDDRNISIGIKVDRLSIALFVMVGLIGTLVHCFSLGFMAQDPRRQRYFAYLSFFCFSMFGLLLASNLLVIFVFWELVGLSSYLLIGFWYERPANVLAGNKAFLVNRIGDLGLILAIGLIWSYFGTLDLPLIEEALANTPSIQQSRLLDPLNRFVEQDPSVRQMIPLHGDLLAIPQWVFVVAGIGLLGGAAGKSAQFPFHVWLPDAMAGPTPVSALIHAATMVTAGVYLLARVSFFLTVDVEVMIAYIGAITLLIGGTIAVVQVDYKKVLAYSTVSQLGFMMLAIGVGGRSAGLFHLLTHASFKALLFLGAGSIYLQTHSYDLRGHNRLRDRMPITAFTMLLGTLAIAGVPLLSGFYSKDAILSAILRFVQTEPQHLLLLIAAVIGASLTAFYMFRMWFHLFGDRGVPTDRGVPLETPSADQGFIRREGGLLIWGPLVLLSIPTVLAGTPVTLLPGFGEPPLLEQWFESTEFGEDVVGAAIARRVIGLSILALIVGFGFAFLLYGTKTRRHQSSERPTSTPRKSLNDFLTRKWYFDEVYNTLFIQPIVALSRFVRWLDEHVLDRLVLGVAGVVRLLSRWERWLEVNLIDGFVVGVSQLTMTLGDRFRKIQNGQLRFYLMILSAAVLLSAIGIIARLIQVTE